MASVPNQTGPESLPLTLTERHNERDLEDGLIEHLTKPIGVSEYQITENLPKQFRPSIPSIKQIEAELADWEDE
nr:hypothetical protein [Rhodopirellula sp. SM50]